MACFIRTACNRDRVTTITTPGETVDVLVTDRGIAVNPNRPELAEAIREAGLPLKTIQELQQLAESLTGKPKELETNERIVAVVEYRDGTVLDVVRQVRD